MILKGRWLTTIFFDHVGLMEGNIVISYIENITTIYKYTGEYEVA